MAIHKVTYVGLSDIREMSQKDLDAAGVGVAADLVWDKTRSGRFPSVYIEDMSERLAEIFVDEGTFTVQEVDAGTLRDLNVEPIADGQPLDDTGRVVRDGTTGQVSERGEADANADPAPVAPTGEPIFRDPADIGLGSPAADEDDEPEF